MITRTTYLWVATLICLVGLACDRGATPPPEKPQLTHTTESQTPTGPTLAHPVREPTQPLSPQEITDRKDKIAATQDYRERIEARRALFHRLRRHDQSKEARNELVAILDDVENEEGDVMAKRVAFNEAGNLVELKDYELGIVAYKLLLDRYPDNPFSSEALTYIGRCYLETGNYEEAEATWQRLVEEHDSSRNAPWGWRKLALAQLLQGEFDASLTTLEVMSEKYAGTPFAEYAKFRRGYVLMAANRLTDARSCYTEFLKECAKSKYCKLAREQLAELDQYVALAKANVNQD